MLHTLVLVASVLAADLPHDPLNHATERAISLATLTPAAAADLAGRRGLFVVVLAADMAPDDEDAASPVVRDCLPADGRVCRTVVLPPGNHPGDMLVVEGVLRVVRHKAFRGPDGAIVPAVVQLRIEADRVR
jgi:hypothetical protein